MQCPTCGHVNRAQYRFCAACGVQLPDAGSAADARRCRSCGSPSDNADKYCGTCGRPFVAPAPHAARRRPVVLHAPPPRREDPRLAPRARGRAQAGDGPVRRREGLDGARRAARPGGRGTASWTASSPSSPTACTASRARSTSTPATASWRCSARRSRTRTTPSAPATRRCTCATSCAATPTSCASSTA